MIKIKRKKNKYNKIMEILKIYMIAALFLIFLPLGSFSVKAAELKDCSEVKKLHKKLICQLGGGKTKEEQSTKGKNKFNKIFKSTLADYFKKEE